MKNKKIAIIGYASRLPQTSDATFWEDLLAGRNLLTRVAEDRWAQYGFEHPSRAHPGSSVTFAAGSLGDVGGFDAGFFRISPREAAAMDPQQRLLLEMSWEAFAHAGIPVLHLRGSRCGVFIGLASTDYAYRMADDLAAIGANSATGSTASIAANRLSYFYDLHPHRRQKRVHPSPDRIRRRPRTGRADPSARYGNSPDSGRRNPAPPLRSAPRRNPPPPVAKRSRAAASSNST